MYQLYEHVPTPHSALAAICASSRHEAVGLLQVVVDELRDEGFRIVALIDSGTATLQEISQAAQVLAQTLDSRTDLVALASLRANDVSGDVSIPILQRASVLKIPALTVVNIDQQQRWHDLGNGCSTTLPADSAAILDWCWTSITGHPSEADRVTGDQDARDSTNGETL